MDLRLDKRIIFVTGGSRGIGRRIVEDLLKEGALVSTCARNMPDLEQLRDSLPEPLQNRLLIQECDVRSPEAVLRVVEHTIQQYGRLDGVVTNAGFGVSGRVLDTPPDVWVSQYEMKILSVINAVGRSCQRRDLRQRSQYWSSRDKSSERSIQNFRFFTGLFRMGKKRSGATWNCSWQIWTGRGSLAGCYASSFTAFVIYYRQFNRCCRGTIS